MKNAVIGIVFSPDKKKLLILERRDVPVWVLPGGGIDENETSEEAIIRETFEETGLHVSIVKKIGEYYPINCLTAPTHVFECKEESGHLSIGDETNNLGFYPIDNLPKNFFFLHRHWLQDALLNSHKILKKPISQITYWQVVKFLFFHPTLMIRYIFSRFFLKSPKLK